MEPRADDLDSARQLLRQGLLADASAELARVPPSASAAEQAASVLLSGNIAYERGQYDVARGDWRRAAELYAQLEPGGEGERVARENLSMASDQLERQARIQDRVGHIQLAVGLVALLAVLALALAFRRSAGAAA
ncbi:MAG TPA: hypothetical protein VFY71_04170 [Planctomycetota bacterium]|nr:hypothetical protein [Planctomycetota bacterium]